MMASADLTITVKAGPWLMAAIDPIEVVEDALEEIPEWNMETRKRIEMKLKALGDQVSTELAKRGSRT